MGTIIRITCNGVVIETNQPPSSMKTCSNNLLDKMCNNLSNVEEIITENKIDQHTIMKDCVDSDDYQNIFMANAISRTQSSELDVTGWFLTIRQ